MRADWLPLLDKRLPRYTSYPTAVQFGPQVRVAEYQDWLAALPAGAPLSIYLHVPFCKELCLYCGCHTSVARRYTPVAAFVDVLEQEIALVSRHVDGRHPVVHLHWGGGTPTILSAQDFARLMNVLGRAFPLDPAAEVAIEIDPRTMSRDKAKALADAGVTRASLGVQDFDETVQRAVGRLQSYEQTAHAADWLRGAGVAGINLDLMYGLPHQTVQSVAATIERALSIEPDRMALFGYAHVPWMKRHQRLLPEAALPSQQERLEQFGVASSVMMSRGYQPIGLDHFAKPGDLLVQRQREKRLHRNFQGYTIDEASALIGFGPSAISALPQGYVQNEPGMVAYRNAIEAGRLATVRGCVLTDDDRLRREVIERLMCDFEVNLTEVLAKRGRRVDAFDGEILALDGLAERGLVCRDRGRVVVPDEARPLVRTVCAVFDAYLANNETRFSRAV